MIQVECENGKLSITPREPEEYIMSRTLDKEPLIHHNLPFVVEEHQS